MKICRRYLRCFLGIFAAIILFLSSVIMCGYSSDIKSIDIKDIGLVLQVPDGVKVVGQGTDTTDSVFSDLNMPARKVKKQLEIQGAYYAMFADDYKYEYYLMADSSVKLENIANLKQFSKDELAQFYKDIQKDAGSATFSDTFSTMEVSDILYIIYDLDVKEIKYRKFAAVINGYFYSLQVYGGSSGVDEDACSIAEKILKGIVFEHYDPMPQQLMAYRRVRAIFVSIALLGCIMLLAILVSMRREQKH